MPSRPVATGVNGGSISSHEPPPRPRRESCPGSSADEAGHRDLRARQHLQIDLLGRQPLIQLATSGAIVSASLG